MKLILTLSAVLAAVLLFMIAVRTPIAFPADSNLSTQNAYTDSGELVRAYYRALDERDIATAIGFVPDDVVLEFTLLNTGTRVKYDSVFDVQHWLESTEAKHTVLSRSVSEVYVIGNRVEFTLTEWVNPPPGRRQRSPTRRHSLDRHPPQPQNRIPDSGFRHRIKSFSKETY